MEAKLIKRELKYKGKIIDIYKDRVLLPNGNETDLDFIKHMGASAIVPVTNDGKFVLIKQFRHAGGGYLYEIPAGLLDKEGEEPLDCAQRELKEETGFKAKKWSKLASIKTTPGFCDEVIHIFLAEDLTSGDSAHEFDEVIDVKYFSRDEIESMLDVGEITDSKTLIGLYSALKKIGERKE